MWNKLKTMFNKKENYLMNIEPQYGQTLKTINDVGLIKKNSYVTCVTNLYKEKDYCIIKDKQGNQEKAHYKDLTYFVKLKYLNGIFEVSEIDFQDTRDGQEEIRYCTEYITKNVRSDNPVYTFDILNDNYLDSIIYQLPEEFQFDYIDKDSNNIFFTNTQIKDIVMNDVIYGFDPKLQSTTLAGYSKKGIDSDENKKSGVYLLNDSQYYEVIRKYDDVECYKLVEKESGCTKIFIFKEKLDWQKFKRALIIEEISDQFKDGYLMLLRYPNLINILYPEYEKLDKFKLSSEFN